jgi:hypothetical protein
MSRTGAVVRSVDPKPGAGRAHGLDILARSRIAAVALPVLLLAHLPAFLSATWPPDTPAAP